MSETLPPFDETGLSQEDQEALHAFLVKEDWESKLTSEAQDDLIAHEQDEPSLDEMLALFCEEVDDDIAMMRQALQQAERDDQLQPALLTTLTRPAHKIRGTAGAMGYHTMAELAHMIEIVIEQVTRGTLFPLIAFNVVERMVTILEEMLNTLVETGQEDDTPYRAFLEELKHLGLDLAAQPSLQQPPTQEGAGGGKPRPYPRRGSTSDGEGRGDPSGRPACDEPSTIRVEARRIDQLALHIEELAYTIPAVENAEEQLENALQKLQAAQARVQSLEEMLMVQVSLGDSLVAMSRPIYYNSHENHPPSSLIARILTRASQHQGMLLRGEMPSKDTSPPEERYRCAPNSLPRTRSRLVKADGARPWDELELERTMERERLLLALHEAIADVSLAQANVRSVFLHLRMHTRRYIAQTATMRGDIHSLCVVPFRRLASALRKTIAESEFAHFLPIQCEVTGEATEIDQDILEGLKQPLLQLVRTCLSDALMMQSDSIREQHTIWLRVQAIGSEAVIEIGFSMMVHGGAIDAVRPSIQHLNGVISSQRNATGGISFHIRLPRSQGAVRCLQVRAGEQRVIVPFVQVQRISEGAEVQCNKLYTLHELLGMSETAQSTPHIQPVLILLQHPSRLIVGVAVDEVEREVELMVRPLASYLQRPGITGAAIDGTGSVLLMVDLPELVRHYVTVHPVTVSQGQQNLHLELPKQRSPQILIADDSMLMRQSLLMLLEQEGYSVREAQDGVEALEQLVEQPPDAFILDMDMPNLNGFDLLNIMHLYPELGNVKIVMLTSRSSEKDRHHALKLGAHAYLLKPCQQEQLLETLQNLLVRD
jgi:chemosensory pili system protein ChpA (sensor histidine kinase/response regulator)